MIFDNLNYHDSLQSTFTIIVITKFSDHISAMVCCRPSAVASISINYIYRLSS